MKSKTITSLVLFGLLLGISPISFGRDRIVFSCALEKSDPQYEYLLNLYRDAFNSLDMDFSFFLTPLARTIVSAASGHTDGECARVHDYIEVTGTPNLVRVDVSTISFDIQVWSRSPEISVSSVEDLLKAGSGVGYRRGAKWLEIYLDQQDEVVKVAVNTVSSGLKMLAAERLDFYVGSSMHIENSRNRINLRRPIYLVGTLVKLKLNPFLHQRHHHLAAPLAAELERLLDTRAGPIR